MSDARFTSCMSGRSNLELAAARRAGDIRRALGRDYATLRVDAGLNRSRVARAARLSPSSVGRVEDGLIEPDLETMVRLASVLGCDVSIRLFPTGPPIRDRLQAPMLEAILALAHPAWRRLVEVPVAGVVPGVIDGVLAHPARPLLVAIEVQSELRRAEETIRRATEKAEALGPSRLGITTAAAFRVAGAETSRLLVLRSTASTRAVVRDLERTFAAAWPARAAEVLAALRDPLVPWPGPAIVWMSLHGRVATVMAGPPRGIAVGR